MQVGVFRLLIAGLRTRCTTKIAGALPGSGLEVRGKRSGRRLSIPCLVRDMNVRQNRVQVFVIGRRLAGAASTWNADRIADTGLGTKPRPRWWAQLASALPPITSTGSVTLPTVQYRLVPPSLPYCRRPPHHASYRQRISSTPGAESQSNARRGDHKSAQAHCRELRPKNHTVAVQRQPSADHGQSWQLVGFSGSDDPRLLSW